MKHCNSCRWWMPGEVTDRNPEYEVEAMCRYKHPSELERTRYGYEWTEVHGWGTCRHHSRHHGAMLALWWLERWYSFTGWWSNAWWRWVKYPLIKRKHR